MTVSMLAVEAAGWFGAAMILIAFVLVSTGRIEGRSIAFQLMNLLGAIGFIINTAWHGAIPSVVLNLVWCVVAIATLVSIRRQKRAGG